MATTDTLRTTNASAGKKLLQALILELKMHSPRFNTLNEDSQGETIDRLRAQVDDAVREAVNQIAAGGHSFIKARLESVTFKDEAKLTLKSNGDANKIVDGVGRPVAVVFIDPDLFLEDLQTVKPEPNQRDAFQRGPGMEDDDEEDA